MTQMPGIPGGAVMLQVRVKKSVAETIADLADKANRPQSWIVAFLLEVMINDEKHRKFILEQISCRLFEAINNVTRWTGGRKNIRKDKSEVRLQFAVTETIAAKLEQLGERLNHSAVQMTGLLLETAVSRYEWLLRAVIQVLKRFDFKNEADAIESQLKLSRKGLNRKPL